MTAAEPGAAALEPTRVHLRQAAAARAARIRADAHHSAGRIREQARLAAAATVEQARADGHAEAAPLAAAELSQGRETAAKELLRARSRPMTNCAARCGQRSAPCRGNQATTTWPGGLPRWPGAQPDRERW